MIKKTLVAFALSVALIVPATLGAHEPHPAGAPAHPVGSPDYHEVTEATPVVTTTSDDVQRSILLQLLDLLRAKLALLLGTSTVVKETPVSSDNTDDSERVVEVKTEYVTIYTEDGYRYFETKAIPDHDTGSFPNQGNPNTISEQDLEYKVTLNPAHTGDATPVQLPGIALNGIPMEPGTAEREGDYNVEALQDTYNLGLDSNNAHVQPTGLYHYHGVPEGYLDNVETDEDMVPIGYAADGFPMYHSHAGQYTSGWELVDERSDGSAPDGTYTQDFVFTDAGSLDECNGAWIDDETYGYFITDEFPYIPRCLYGTPDSSFNKGPGAGGLPPRR